MLVLQNSEKDHLLLKIEHQLSFGKDSSSTNEKFMPLKNQKSRERERERERERNAITLIFLNYLQLLHYSSFSKKVSVALTMKRKPITINYMFMSRYNKAFRVYLFVFLILQFCLSHFCNLLISANMIKIDED